MKHFIISFLFIVLTSAYGQVPDVKNIRGRVTANKQPLANANVSNGTKELKTDPSGMYSISAAVGDMLVFSYTGMRPVEIIVEDVTRILNVELPMLVEQLDNVTVTHTVHKSQEDLLREYNSNPNLIKTSTGIRDKNRVGYAMQMIQGDKLTQGTVDFIQAIQFQFPGIRVDRTDPSNPRVYLRRGLSTNTSLSVVFDLDGTLLTNAPVYLDVSNIDRLALIPGMAGSLLYGNLARGGVIVINTKNAGSGRLDPKTGNPYDEALQRNNIFGGKALPEDQVQRNSPTYLQELYSAGSEAEAIERYEAYYKLYGQSFDYLLDAYRYFNTQWQNEPFAASIIAQNWSVFQGDPLALKALAYIYDSCGKNEAANLLYKDIFILRPGYAQSYRDLANSYRLLGNAARAIAIYSRYAYLVSEGLLPEEDEGFHKIIEREFYNSLENTGANSNDTPSEPATGSGSDFKGTRLLFEWNDSEAEFHLQFVNPDNRYYTWHHNLMNNPSRIRDEKIKGYSCEEYLIDSLEGTWLVNITYTGNKRLSPTYLKATIYHNYGLPSQRSEIMVFKLRLKDVNQQLFAVTHRSPF